MNSQELENCINSHRADAWQKGWATGFSMAAIAALGGTLLVMFFRNLGE